MHVTAPRLLRSALITLLLCSPALAQTGTQTGTQTATQATTPKQSAPRLEVFKIVTTTVNGKPSESRVAVTATRPGDLLERVITFTSAGTVRPARLRLAVPKDTEYVAGSARTSLGRLEFRAAGSEAFVAVPMKSVPVTAGGVTRMKQVPVPEQEYTDVSAALPATTPGTVITFTHRLLVK